MLFNHLNPQQHTQNWVDRNLPVPSSTLVVAMFFLPQAQTVQTPTSSESTIHGAGTRAARVAATAAAIRLPREELRRCAGR